ncbi:Transmembrane protein 43 family [Phytophthora cactorum]|nr:Transmembrane protein 43 family [Phytophthora cactorum]
MGQKEVTIGGLLLLVSVATTCVYESALVRSVKSFEEGRSVVVSLPKPQVSASNEAKLIHFSGLITTQRRMVIPNGINAIQTSCSSDKVRSCWTRLSALRGWRRRTRRRAAHLRTRTAGLMMIESGSTCTTCGGEKRRLIAVRSMILVTGTLRQKLGRTSRSWSTQRTSWWGNFRPDELVDQIQRRDGVHLDTASRRVMANLLDQRQGATWEDGSALTNVTVEDDILLTKRDEGTCSWRSTDTQLPCAVCAKQKDNELVPFKTSLDGIMTADQLFDKKTHAEVRKNRFFRLFAAVLGFMGFLVLRRPLIERFGSLVAGIQQHLLASSMSLPSRFLSLEPIGFCTGKFGGWMASTQTRNHGGGLDGRPGHGHQRTGDRAAGAGDCRADGRGTEDGMVRPNFPALSAQQQSGGKNDFRRVRVPAHRYTPLKNDWPNIMKPIVEHLKLQIRMNTKTRCIELKNSPHTTDSGALQKAADFVQAY